MLNFCGKKAARGILRLVVAILVLLFAGCGNGNTPEKKTVDCGKLPALEFSRNLKIGKLCGENVAEIRSIVGRDTLVKQFSLQEKTRRVVALSSAQIGFMLRLGLADRIVAVGEGKYVADSALYARVQRGEVAEVGNGPTLSLEKLMTVQPDLVMDFATGGGQDDYERINSLGIPLMLTSEWQEEHPLAKVEWIKLFGALFGKESLADSIYEQSKQSYLKAVGEGNASSRPCPRVIAGMNYGGVWYAPGGNSFTARLIKDAGGCYLWASDTSRELTFTLEEIMLVADSADVWVNPGAFSSPEDLLAAEPRIKHIRAFREKRVCQNDGRKGPGGGNDFYESAVAYPAELLLNLRDCIQNATNGADSVRKEFDWYRNIFIF